MSMQNPEEHEDAKFIASRDLYTILSHEGSDELKRPVSGLMWSGIVAGLCITFSLIAEGIIRYHMPDAPSTFLIENLGYTLGFIIVIMGR